MRKAVLLPSELMLFIFFVGCASQHFAAIPPGLDRSTVPQQTIKMTAQDFHFTPDVIHVKQGTFVRLEITSIEGTHGFALSDFGIDERLDEGKTVAVEFYAQKKGEYGFRCSHFCGIGHLGMTGKIIVE
jgi:cytochrome c oxidase subunit 2